MFIPPGAIETPKVRFWRKIEKYCCLSMSLVVFAFVLKDAYKQSQDIASKNHIAGVIRGSWFSNNYIDVNDGQLRSFLDNLPLLSLIAFIFVVLRKLMLFYVNELGVQLAYYIAIGTSFITYIHGPGILFVLLYLLGNFVLLKIFIEKKWFPILIWLANVSFLVLTEYNDGYKFGWIYSGFSILDYSVPLKWHRTSNLLMLKIISFLIDCHWSYLNKPHKTKEKHQERCDECSDQVTCLKFRYEKHANIYSLPSFIAYTIYPPLYLAGPTLTYNAWISQVQDPQQTHDYKRIAFYILRLIFIFAILELWINTLYYPAIANNKKNKYIWEEFTPYELAIGSYVILKWIWLKFMLIWRFFRLWALLDGIETPENLGKCISNMYCFEGFWRMWHRSFNLWLVRYLFIPLGGSKYKILNIWVVFGFVALWHDLRASLLVWGWGMCLFIVPETLVKGYFNQSKFAKFRETLQYSWLSVIAGAFYLFLLAVANLVGFSFGIDGLLIATAQIISWEGLFLITKLLLTFIIVVHFMMMIRNEDLRSGKIDQGF